MEWKERSTLFDLSKHYYTAFYTKYISQKLICTEYIEIQNNILPLSHEICQRFDSF
jgi:hypothetical protein